MENGFRRQTDSLPTCMNCSSVLYGGFCSQCGQKSTDEITFRGLVAELRDRVLKLEDPWLRTPLELTHSPGKMIRGYLRGRRLPYVGPLSYAFAASALLAALVWIAGFDLSSPHTPWGGSALTEPSYGTFVFGCFSIFWVTGLVAWVQWALHRQKPYSPAQTWIFDLYAFGHLALLQAVFAGLGAFASDVGLLALFVAMILGLATALSSFYRIPPWAGLPAALILSTVYAAGIFTSAALFRLLTS